jgi:hypothetical protein
MNGISTGAKRRASVLYITLKAIPSTQLAISSAV